MSKILKALLISAATTGAAAAVVHLLKKQQEKPGSMLPPSRSTILEADDLPAETQAALLEELEAQL